MQNADTAAAATLMDQLSKGRYSSRQNATLKMWGARDELREQVQAAARHSNPEVSGRAKWILDQWRRGTSPDMPSNVLRLLQQGDDPAAIVELIELGRFADAVVAVQESAQSIEFDRIKVMVNSALASRFPFYIQQAIQEESLADLLQLIDLSAIGKEMAVCRIRLMQTIGIEIEEDQLLPKAAETWAPARRDESLVAVLNILGRQDESIAVAKKSANASLLRVALMLADDWQSLTDMALESLEQGDDSNGKSKPGSRMLLEETIHWIHALVAADRCGDRKAGEKAIAALSGVRPDHEGFDLAWKALTLHGQIDAVLAMLDRDSPQDLVDVALAASRADAVFENLQYPRAQLETNLESWIDEAVDQQQLEMALIEKPGQDNRGLRRARNNPDRPNVGTERLLALMKCLITVGREDAARQIADRLASEPIVFGSSRDNHPLRDFVLQSLVSTARSEWVFDLAVAEGDQTISRTAKWCTSRLLPGTESMTLDLMLDAMQRMYGKMPFEGVTR